MTRPVNLFRSRWGSSRWDRLAGFRCIHCGGFISADPRLSGVLHRNHCPFCLWSRHVDLIHPGDRLAACQAQMQPVGLTLKRSQKKYGPATQGELMLIHRCAGCGKLSLNRIAADDDPGNIINILHQDILQDSTGKQLAAHGIRALDWHEHTLVQARLFGNRA